ncbi:MAG: hypothetical protein JXQ99_05680 [Hyphomicrobiaceae bacterium]
MAKEHRWIGTSVPPKGRYDDIFFIDENMGWVVGGGIGEVLRTEDGGRTWSEPTFLDRRYPRAIGMLDKDVGWIGCINGSPPLLKTTDGWRTFKTVHLPSEHKGRLSADGPTAVCGLQVFDDSHIFAAGTNFPLQPARFLKSLDGGDSWIVRDMEDHATILVDVWFTSPTVGWLVGARVTRPHSLRDDVIPVVLKTIDGGNSWEDRLQFSPEMNPPLGEWGWKIQFVDDEFIVVACENFRAGAILISQDAGEHWVRCEIRNSEGAMINENLEGIGFLNRKVGWVGGWGDQAVSSGRTSATTDGGKTWTDLTKTWAKPTAFLTGTPVCSSDVDKGQYINRFRFINGFGYAAGNSVYKYTDEPESDFSPVTQTHEQLVSRDGALRFGETATIPVEIPPGIATLQIDIFDRFGAKVRSLATEKDPAAGPRLFEWDVRDDNGRALPLTQFQLRVTLDDKTDSRLIFHERTPVSSEKRDYTPYMLLEE